MADVSGRTDLAVGDIAEAGGHITEYTVGTGGVTKGDCVIFSAAMTVVKSTAAGEKAAGIAVQTKAAGAVVGVLDRGVIKATADDAIAQGSCVGTGASAKILVQATGTWAIAKLDEHVGKNIGAAATADGDLILLRVNIL